MTHIGYGAGTGAVIGLGIGFYNYYKSGGSLNMILQYGLTGGLVGAATSMLPDIIEPAYNSSHRGFAHSYILGIIILGGLCVNFTRLLNSDLLGVVCASGCGGYLSHLLLDSITPVGLPFISRDF